MKLVHNLVQLFFSTRIKRIERSQTKPAETQWKTLKSLLETTKETAWGKDHGYENIKTITDFQRQVPISSYEDLFPYIERMLSGEESVLWPGLVTWFSKSSGTTNDRSKYIPMPEKSIYQCHFRGGKDMTALYLKQNPDSRVSGGKTIGVGGSIDESEFDKRIKVGDMSAVLMRNLPSWAEYLRAGDINTATMPHWETKLDALAKATMDEDVRALAGVPTWTMLLIKKVVELKKAKNILEVWPNLEVFFHGAVAFDPYREVFKELIPSDQMHYVENYNASEGYFAIQDDPNRPNEMMLMLDYGIFYEFIPMDVFGTEQQYAVTLEDVEIGKNYAIVITTNGGLPRYLIGDTVTFTTTDPHRIRITGRTKHFINAFGEELMVSNVDQAIAKACEATSAKIADYTGAPIYMAEDKSKGGHEWVMEFDQDPSSLDTFTKVFDDTLKEVNSDYAAKRKGELALASPIIHIAPPGTFYEWMKSRGKLGGQNKVPRLSNNRKHIEGVLEILKK